MSELRLYASQKKKPQKYLIQLSDLHIGDSKITCGKKRIKALKFCKDIIKYGVFL